MSLATTPRQLNDGTTIPPIGFGTAGLRGEDAIAAVTSALENGYRLIDTAVNYGNEVEVGEAIRRSGVPRDEIVVTSKIPGRHHAYDDAITSTRESLERLGLDRIDVHLIHWPNPAQEKYHETWRALVQLRDDGLVRSPGVSNFTRAHLDEGHRRHRRDAGAQPDRAAPVLPAGGDARRRRRARRPHRVVEPDGQAAGAVRRASRSGRPPRRTASRPARWCCAGSSSSAPCRSRSPRPRPGSARTSTSTASSSPTTRWLRSRLSPGRTAGCSAATPTATRSSEPKVASAPTTPYLRVDLDRLRRNVRSTAEWATTHRLALRPHVKTHKSPGDRPAPARPRARSASPWRRWARPRSSPSTAAPTSSSPIRSTSRSGPPSGCAAWRERGRVAIGVDSVEGAARAGRLPRAVRRRGGRRGRLRPAPHRLPARGGGLGGRRRRPGRAHGARGVHLPGAQLRARRDGDRSGGRGPRAGHRARGRRARGARGVCGQRRLDTELRPSRHRCRSPRPGPGVYVFGDAQQWELGSMPPESIALTCRATVVSLAGGRVVLDAGSKALAADRAAYSTGSGRLLDHPEARIVQLSEHHAVVDLAGRTAPPGRQPARRRPEPLLRRGQPRRRPVGRGARRPAALAGRRPGAERLSRATP